MKEETKESREASMDLVAGHWCSSIGHIPSLRSVIVVTNETCPV